MRIWNLLSGIHALPIIILISTLAIGCDQPDSIDAEKGRVLDPDERYLVELYMKINELEQNLQNNPADSLEKWNELRATVDSSRVMRTLEKLEKEPERWLAIYNRINDFSEDDR
jgi:hypothetical protein